MELLNLRKRKKLKTRKNRDKLRGNCSLLKHKDKSENNLKSSLTIFNIDSITSDRLTLKVFPRAVSSETLTRPLLEKMKIPNTDIQKNLIIQEHNDSSNFVNDDEMPQDLEAGNFLFSPSTHKVEYFYGRKQEIFSSNDNEVTKFNVEYKKLMDELSLNLEKQFPHLIYKDVMAENKKKLQELCFTNHQRYENNGPKSEWQNISHLPEAGVPKKLIMENRNDCLKATLRQQSLKCSDESSNSRSLHTPAESPCFSFKPGLHANTQIFDTPEYTFYPHKLK